MTSIILSIIIPCYNEAENIPDLIKKCELASMGYQGIEFILVNNGSTDSTNTILSGELSRTRKLLFRTITLPQNQGYGAGIIHGLRSANGLFLAWTHADMQCDPMDIFYLYDKIRYSDDPRRCFGKGLRITRESGSNTLTLLHGLFSSLILCHKMSDINSQPKIFHRDFFTSLRIPPTGFELDIYAYFLALERGMNIITHNVAFKSRKHGSSKWATSLWSRSKFILHNIIYVFFLKVNRKKI